MSVPVPCKYLDYAEGKYTDCQIKTLAPHYPQVRFWQRGERWTAGPSAGSPPGPRDVQFCGQGRGRINGILQCYLPGEMSCYRPADPLP